MLHLPRADRRRALRHRRRRGRARRPARRLGRRDDPGASTSPGSASCWPRTSPWSPRGSTARRWSTTGPSCAAGSRPPYAGPSACCPAARPVLGMADVVVLNDPLTSQGSNNATKSASFYLEAINAHDGAFDARWMQRTFDNFWRGWAHWATQWTNSWLQPAAPHQRAVIDAAPTHPSVAETDRGRLRRRPAVQPVVVRPRRRRRRSSPPQRRRRGPASTRATCDGRWASTPPASPS